MKLYKVFGIYLYLNEISNCMSLLMMITYTITLYRMKKKEEYLDPIGFFFSFSKLLLINE